MQEMTPTDAWVSNLLTNVIAQIASSLDNCEIDPVNDIGMINLTFERGVEVEVTIQFRKVNEAKKWLNLD